MTNQIKKINQNTVFLISLKLATIMTTKSSTRVWFLESLSLLWVDFSVSLSFCEFLEFNIKK